MSRKPCFKIGRKWVIDDLTGRRFGKWTVLSRTENYKGRAPQWICRCDCGLEKTVSGRSLTQGWSKGCMSCRKLPKDLGNLRQRLYLYKKGAQKRGLEWSLTEEQTFKLFKGNCSYCGREPYQSVKRYAYGKHGTVSSSTLYNGIDRIDNDRGYVQDNVQSCCGECNFAKHKLSESHFLNLVKMIYDHRIKKVKVDNEKHPDLFLSRVIGRSGGVVLLREGVQA